MITALDIPPQVIEAAQLLTRWAAENNIQHWAIGGVANREFNPVKATTQEQLLATSLGQALVNQIDGLQAGAPAGLRSRADAYDRLALAASRSPCFMLGDDWLEKVEQWMDGDASPSAMSTVDLRALANFLSSEAAHVFSVGPFQVNDIIEWFKSSILAAADRADASPKFPQTSKSDSSS